MRIGPSLFLCAIAPLCILSACGPHPTGELSPQAAIELLVESKAFNDGARIPQQYTCDGADISPPLSWSEPPPGTESLALIVEDPDAPDGPWTHWVVFNIPPTTRSLPEGVTSDDTAEELGTQGKNCWHDISYGGPCPPEGAEHRYFFRVYALDTVLDVEAGTGKKPVQRAMEGHILAQGELMGRHSR
jgi:Raf kinase inhibitor-like YbhB/YbcL family protein